MEDNPKEILSPLLEKPQVQKQMDFLSEVVDEAQKRIDYTTAHDEEILKAIEIVERFLRKRERICYGGQAINALLPPSRRFYDERYTIPDYDFFSPNVAADSEEIVKMLEEEGFTDVTYKVGMHEGTRKVNVNFIPVADISEMHPTIFKTLQKRAHRVDGILYCDPDFLRMMMYLELSRPRGQVERWKKVFERLTLLNHSYPVEECHSEIHVKDGVSWEDRKQLLLFCQKHKRPVAGPEAIFLLERNKSHTRMKSLIEFGGPVIFFSPQAELDAQDILDILPGRLSMKKQEALFDNIFSFITIYRGGKPLALILNEDTCLGYTLLTFQSGAQLRISTPDTLLHLYYAFMIFGTKEKSFFQTSLECLIQKIYHIAHKARLHPTHFVPAFGIKCSGTQKGVATLRKERHERTEKEKHKKKNNKDKSKNKTRKLKLNR